MLVRRLPETCGHLECHHERVLLKCDGDTLKLYLRAAHQWSLIVRWAALPLSSFRRNVTSGKVGLK